MDLRGSGGQSLGRHVCEPDIEPACEAIRFQALRNGEAFDIPSSAFESIPIWEETRGEPHIAGIRVSYCGTECVASATSCFDDAARGVSARLLDLGQISEDERVQYEVVAFPEEAPRATVKARFQIEDLPSTPDIREVDIAALSARSTPVDEDPDSHLQVFIPGHVIDELYANALAANGIENGSILIGHLCRDPLTRALATVITAQMPAEATEGDATRLKFTAATWEAGVASARGRGRGEIMLGTSHSHPARYWCAKCTLEKQRDCSLAQPFLSPSDKILHRTVFTRPWTVSLVVVDAADGVRHGLFGWHNGELLRRAYRLLDGASAEIFRESFNSINSSNATK